MEYYIFEVSANNSGGKGWGEGARTIVYTIETNTRKTPDTPSKPSISKSSIKANELTISWTTNSDNYSPIRYFQIQMSEEIDNRSAEWKTIYLYKCANSNLNNNYRLTIRGLNKQNEQIIKPNGHVYKFRLASTNDIGTSEFSDESNTIKSKYDLPRANLFNLTARPLDLSRVRLRWTETRLVDDALTKFKIVYRRVTLNGDESSNTASSSSSLGGNEVIIEYKSTKSAKKSDDLIEHEYELQAGGVFDPSGKYEFDVCGANMIGASTKCAQTQSLVYMEDRRAHYDQSSVRSVRALSSTEINVTWSAPNPDEINGQLLGYRLVFVNNEFINSPKIRRMILRDEQQTADSGVEFYPDQSSPTPVEPRVDDSVFDTLVVEPDATYVVLSNLKPFKNYSVFVQLINEAGESELTRLDATPFNTAQTFEAMPSQPARIEFSYIAYTFLNVTLYRPRDPNGVLKAYELWYENVPTSSSSSKNLAQATTKIIRQEILSNLEAENQTLFISNLEPQSTYKFKVRCKTSIDWGPYLERIVYTGPQLRKNYAKLMPTIGETNVNGESTSSGLVVVRDSAPLSPSKPVYTPLNDSHSLLEWKSYTLDYEMFIVEIKLINLMEVAAAAAASPPGSVSASDAVKMATNGSMSSSSSSTTSSSTSEFEIFAYSNTTSLFIDKYDKQLSALLVAKLPQNQIVAASSAASLLCVFRVLSFGRMGISEPSAISDLVSVSKLTSPSLLMSSISKELSGGGGLGGLGGAQFYLNWWFLVIVALASCTFLIIVVLVMLLRGKNKKFLMKKQKMLQQQHQREQQQLQQQKMNTIKMMKITAPNSR